VPIIVLIAIIAVVVVRLPRVERRSQCGAPASPDAQLGAARATYAFLYMARYNMTCSRTYRASPSTTSGNIDFWGSLTYGLVIPGQRPARRSARRPDHDPDLGGGALASMH